MLGRAEYKVPGGKLLRVDVQYSDVIEAVELHGDFFIYPEDELDTIHTALQGIAADTDTETMAAQVADAVDDATDLVGFEPADVARVVVEAVNDA